LSAGALAQDRLELAAGASSDWVIVQMSPDQQTRFAAEELQRYIQQICGARLPLQSAPRSSYNIYVGLRENIPTAFQACRPLEERFDGCAGAAFQQQSAIVSAGDNHQGTIYGVYDFLEQLGCRWFYPGQDIRDKEVVPEKQRLLVAVGTHAVASPLRH